MKPVAFHSTPFLSPALACLGLAAAGLAAAQPQPLQPGLWEQTMTMKGGADLDAKMAQMQQQLASMPPERRKMVEDMMAKQGIGAGGAAGNGHTIRVCISPEQAARADMPQRDGDCKQDMMERSGATVRFRFSCTGHPPDNAPTTGEGEYTVSSPTAYSGRATVVRQVKGQPEKIDMTQSGRWVSADCGTLKPRQATP